MLFRLEARFINGEIFPTFMITSVTEPQSVSGSKGTFTFRPLATESDEQFYGMAIGIYRGSTILDRNFGFSVRTVQGFDTREEAGRKTLEVMANQTVHELLRGVQYPLFQPNEITEQGLVVARTSRRSADEWLKNETLDG